MSSNKSYNDKEYLVKKILDNDQDLQQYNISEDMLHELINGKVSRNINESQDEILTLGQRTADRIAAFGGSWTFIIIFGIVLVSWMIINAAILMKKAFDPYPFVFLNLVLSCLAAVQAPVIMMSQNRQTEKDRLTATNDYLVNLKSEIIIEDLHKKIDMLIEKQEENEKIQKELKNTIEELKNSK